MTSSATPEPVHRQEDGELVGHLTPERRDDAVRWVACTVFGTRLRDFPARDEAAAWLRREGLRLLAERWWFWSEPEQRWLLTSLVEARPGSVAVRFGYDPDLTTLSGPDLDRLSLTPPG